MIRGVLLTAVVMAASGCLPQNAFAPPPDDWETWNRAGTDKDTLWKDMLECGYASPISGVRVEPDPQRTLSHVAGSMICMERLGYTRALRGKAQPTCHSSGWKATEACVSGKDVPTPDPARRLSSPYCKKYPQATACKG